MRRHNWLFFLALSFIFGCTENPVLELDESIGTEIDDKDDDIDNNDDIDNDTSKCTNECSESFECASDNTYKECIDLNGDGCKEWSEPKVCPDEQICQNGICKDTVSTCTDSCKETAKCINEHSYQTCEDTNNDGCKEWSETRMCSSDEVCQNGSCSKVSPMCTNACSQEGDIQCSQDKLQTCFDYNHDGCLEWGNEISCEYGCSEKECRKFPKCPENADICPKEIEKFNEWIEGDTSQSINIITKYTSCHDVGSTDIADESGPEDYYMVHLDEPGFLVVNVKHGKNMDVDVQILSELNGDSCLVRGDQSTGAHLEAGIHYISVDTYANVKNAGIYQIRLFFLPDSGLCGMNQKIMERINDSNSLQMPVVGKVGRESHLVTTYDQQAHGGDWWPSDAWDAASLEIHQNHTKEMYGNIITYGKSEGDNKWCSCNSKGLCGHASYGKALPPDAEAWDVNMYWKSSTKPAPGTRYLVFNPQNGKAVVAASGYETGPGKAETMGGAVPEIHNYLGTDHGYALVFGELKNQTNEYGPIECFNETSE